MTRTRKFFRLFWASSSSIIVQSIFTSWYITSLITNASLIKKKYKITKNYFTHKNKHTYFLSSIENPSFPFFNQSQSELPIKQSHLHRLVILFGKFIVSRIFSSWTISSNCLTHLHLLRSMELNDEEYRLLGAGGPVFKLRWRLIQWHSVWLMKDNVSTVCTFLPRTETYMLQKKQTKK